MLPWKRSFRYFFSHCWPELKGIECSGLWFTKALFDETNRVCHSCCKPYNGYCVHAKARFKVLLLNAILPGNNDVIVARFILCLPSFRSLCFDFYDTKVMVKILIILDCMRVTSSALFNFFQPFVLDEKKLLHDYRAAVRSGKTEFNVAWPSESKYSPPVERVHLNDESNKKL